MRIRQDVNPSPSAALSQLFTISIQKSVIPTPSPRQQHLSGECSTRLDPLIRVDTVLGCQTLEAWSPKGLVGRPSHPSGCALLPHFLAATFPGFGLSPTFLHLHCLDPWALTWLCICPFHSLCSALLKSQLSGKPLQGPSGIWYQLRNRLNGSCFLCPT